MWCRPDRMSLCDYFILGWQKEKNKRGWIWKIIVRNDVCFIWRLGNFLERTDIGLRVFSQNIHTAYFMQCSFLIMQCKCLITLIALQLEPMWGLFSFILCFLSMRVSHNASMLTSVWFSECLPSDRWILCKKTFWFESVWTNDFWHWQQMACEVFLLSFKSLFILPM